MKKPEQGKGRDKRKGLNIPEAKSSKEGFGTW